MFGERFERLCLDLGIGPIECYQVSRRSGTKVLWIAQVTYRNRRNLMVPIQGFGVSLEDAVEHAALSLQFRYRHAR
jgi:hypothetical protein